MNGNWSDYERFLKPVHLKGEPRTLTIVRITEEETHPRPGETTHSPVLWFKEVPFGLILSPTNRQTLIALYGDEKDQCIGKPITIKAIAMKVGGRDKQPLRIQKQRPSAPQIDTATGEIHTVIQPVVEPPVPQAGVMKQSPSSGGTYPLKEERVITTPAPAPASAPSELDAFFGPRQQPAAQLPTTEAEFLAWLKEHKINGQETHRALGVDAKTWLRKHPEMTWADVARQIQAAQGK